MKPQDSLQQKTIENIHVGVVLPRAWMQLVALRCVEASLLTLNLDDALQRLDCIVTRLLVQH